MQLGWGMQLGLPGVVVADAGMHGRRCARLNLGPGAERGRGASIEAPLRRQQCHRHFTRRGACTSVCTSSDVRFGEGGRVRVRARRFVLARQRRRRCCWRVCPGRWQGPRVLLAVRSGVSSPSLYTSSMSCSSPWGSYPHFSYMHSSSLSASGSGLWVWQGVWVRG
jgi:hypothetical protein